MKIESLGELGRLDMLREKGVRSFEDGVLRLSLAPAEPPPHKPEAPAPDETCRCGHLPYEHGDGGLCLKGCEVEKCAPPEGK